MAATGFDGAAGGEGDGHVSQAQAMLAAKCEEAVAVEAELSRQRFEAQQARIRLQAAGVRDGCVIPKSVQAGSGPANPQQFELQSLFEWLVDGVDLSHQVIFECGNGEGDVMVGGRRVLLHRMATWQLSVSNGGLRLSVPLELQAEIAGLLGAARSSGRGVQEAQVRRLADTWEMVGAEVVSAAVGCPEPAIFLVHRTTAQAIVIAQWPSVDFASWGCGVGAACAVFDPVQHFSRLAAPAPAPPAPPADGSAPGGGAAGGNNAANAAAASAAAEAARTSVSTGDRVEVEFEGQWFAGVLQWVDGDIANVKCDVDSPGVITVAPLTSVRPAKVAVDERPKLQRHMRARSVG